MPAPLATSKSNVDGSPSLNSIRELLRDGSNLEEGVMPPGCGSNSCSMMFALWIGGPHYQGSLLILEVLLHLGLSVKGDRVFLEDAEVSAPA